MFSPNLPPLKWSIESNLTVDNGYDSRTWCGKEEKREGKVCRRQRIFDSGQSFNFIVFDLGKPELRRVTALSWDCHLKSTPKLLPLLSTGDLQWCIVLGSRPRNEMVWRMGLFDGFKYCFLIPGHRWFWAGGAGEEILFPFSEVWPAAAFGWRQRLWKGLRANGVTWSILVDVFGLYGGIRNRF